MNETPASRRRSLATHPPAERQWFAAATTPSASGRHWRRWLIEALGVLTLVLWSAWLIRPWDSGVLEYADFSALRDSNEAHPNWSARVSAWMSHNVTYGRFFPVHVASVVTLWTVFDDSVVAWQIWRFMWMVLVLILCYALLRKVGCSALGTWVGCTLLVCSSASVDLQLKLYQSESIGIAAGLTGALASVGYATADKWRLRALAIAGCLLVAGWARETLIAYLPFVLLLAIPANDLRRIPGFCLSARFGWLAAVCVAATLAVAVPALMTSRAGLYTVSYGPESITVGSVANVFAGVLLPITRQWLFPPNVFVWLTILAGIIVAWRSAATTALWVMAVSVTLLLAGALVYIPWPVFLGYYAAPLVPGLALLLGRAVSLVERSRRPTLVAVAALCLATVMLYGTIIARYLVLNFRAGVALNADVARELSNTPARRRIFITQGSPIDPAAAMAHYARGMLRLPVEASVEAVPCKDASISPMEGKTIWLSAQCTEPPTWVGRSVVRRIEYRHWLTLRRRTDSVYALIHDVGSGQGAAASGGAE